MRVSGAQQDVTVAARACLVFMLLLAAAAGMPAADFELATGNDLFAGNPFNDDRYTVSLDLSFLINENRITLRENMFTDRKGAERRFDETWLGVDLNMPTVGGWATRLNVGAVHVGRGLIGQSGQNTFHRFQGTREYFLEYPDRSRLHAQGTINFKRLAPISSWGRLRPNFEVSAAVDFKYHVEARVDGRWRLLSRTWLEAGGGLRASETNFEFLKPFNRDLGAVGRVGVVWRERIEVAWTHNAFGTGSRHVHVIGRVPLGRRH